MPRWPVKSESAEAKLNKRVTPYQKKKVKSQVQINIQPIPEGASELTGHVRPAHYGAGTIHEVKNCLLAWGLKGNAYLYQAVTCLARSQQKYKTGAEYVETLEKAKTWIQFEIDEANADRRRTVGDPLGLMN